MGEGVDVKVKVKVKARIRVRGRIRVEMESHAVFRARNKGEMLDKVSIAELVLLFMNGSD